MEDSDKGSFVANTIETSTHGRYLVLAGSPRHLLVGFHGYGESAEDQLARLRSFSPDDSWTVLSIQGLHQFYRRRTDEIVASWMTRQSRELAIADNVAYVTRVVRAVLAEQTPSPRLVFAGFSQGVAMAYRAAALLPFNPCGVIACGGDVPPDLGPETLRRIPRVLIGRGERDDWYTAGKMTADEDRLRSAGVQVEMKTFSAGHEWSPEFAEACGRFLKTSLATDSTL
jgi:predicted esterase